MAKNWTRLNCIIFFTYSIENYNSLFQVYENLVI